MLILMKIILKLLFMSDLRLSLIDLNNVNYFNKELIKKITSVAWYPRIGASQRIRKKNKINIY